MKITWYIILALMVMCGSCVKHAKSHSKLFYKNFNYIILKPIGVAYDTLTQLPYVKVDTIQGNYLRLEIINGAFSKKYKYEKYEKGWMIRDTCCDPEHYQFDLYDGSKMISYHYRGNPYQNQSFNLMTVSLIQADYTEDIYLLGLYNDNQTLPNFDFKVDTSKWVRKREIRYLHRNDTFWNINNDFSRKGGKTQRDNRVQKIKL
jgi:hypothetical protein